MNNVTFFPKHFTSRSVFADRFLTIFFVGLLSTSTLISCSHQVQDHRRITEVKEAKTADQIISEMKTGLKLTDEQEVNIYPIVEEQVRKRNELIKKYKGRGRPGMDSLRDELKDLRIAMETRLQYFLTNEQMIKYGYMQQEEDQRIAGVASGKAQEEAGQEKPKGRGRRSGRF